MTRATIILGDFAEPDQTGKVHILGAGWSVTGPAPSPHAVAVFLKVPVERADSPLPVTLRLLDSSGKPVEVPGIGGNPQPLEIVGQIEVRPRDEAWDPSHDLDAVFVVNIGLLNVAPGRVYTWSFEADGKEEASIDFFVRSA
jgi:hypothetical protein